MKIFIVAIILDTEKVNVKINQSLKESALHATRKVINPLSVEQSNGTLDQD